AGSRYCSNAWREIAFSDLVDKGISQPSMDCFSSRLHLDRFKDANLQPVRPDIVASGSPDRHSMSTVCKCHPGNGHTARTHRDSTQLSNSVQCDTRGTSAYVKANTRNSERRDRCTHGWTTITRERAR